MLGVFNFNKKKLDDETRDILEENLLLADLGIKTTEEILDKLYSKKYNKDIDEEGIRKELADIIKNMLEPYAKSLNDIYKKPLVIVVCGINGSGKTTSIAKLANYYINDNKSVYLVAGDSFRAGATIQLEKWANELNLDIFNDENIKNPAAIAYTGIQEGIKLNKDIIIVDTAGRMHNQENLMNELVKIDSVVKKACPTCKQENILVLDSTIGQSLFTQAEDFSKVVNISHIVLTKLDGQAKGGSVLRAIKELKIPILASCYGEKKSNIISFKDDLENFVAKMTKK